MARTAVMDSGISFRTGETLTVSELSVVCATTELMYATLLALGAFSRLRRGPEVELIAIAGREYAEAMAVLLQGWPARSLAYGVTPDPDLYDLLYPDRVLLANDALIDYGRDRQMFLRLVRRSLYRAIPDSALVLSKARISSPGTISFAGLGEPIRELRELIKDLWYRNKQERERGDLENAFLRERLNRIRSENGIPVEGGLDRAELFLANGAATLRALESKGALVHPADHLDEE